MIIEWLTSTLAIVFGLTAILGFAWIVGYIAERFFGVKK